MLLSTKQHEVLSHSNLQYQELFLNYANLVFLVYCLGIFKAVLTHLYNITHPETL